jgi:hypothetical protein
VYFERQSLTEQESKVQMKKLVIVGLILSAFGLSACGRVETIVGPSGPQGSPGVVGAAGAACTVTQDATGATVVCGESSVHLDNGTNGLNGSDGTEITVVQLCPGTTTYPSIFVEVAFCIDNKLYATYSTHGGFSTEIPPGTYSSNAVGSSCTFTVGPDCAVSQ